jgi:hypothetical protein
MDLPLRGEPIEISDLEGFQRVGSLRPFANVRIREFVQYEA